MLLALFMLATLIMLSLLLEEVVGLVAELHDEWAEVEAVLEGVAACCDSCCDSCEWNSAPGLGFLRSAFLLFLRSAFFSAAAAATDASSNRAKLSRGVIFIVHESGTA